MHKAVVVILLAVGLTLLITSPGIIERSGDKPTILELSNQSAINSFCNSKGYKFGTSAYLDTQKNTDGLTPAGYVYDVTWFEFQTIGSGFDNDSVYCMSNFTGEHFQRQYKNYIKGK